MASDFLIHSITLRANFLNSPFDLVLSGSVVDVKVAVVIGIVALLSISINVDENGF